MVNVKPEEMKHVKNEKKKGLLVAVDTHSLAK